MANVIIIIILCNYFTRYNTIAFCSVTMQSLHLSEDVVMNKRICVPACYKGLKEKMTNYPQSFIRECVKLKSYIIVMIILILIED